MTTGILTAKTRGTLRASGYTNKEIDNLTPEEALDLTRALSLERAIKGTEKTFNVNAPIEDEPIEEDKDKKPIKKIKRTAGRFLHGTGSVASGFREGIGIPKPLTEYVPKTSREYGKYAGKAVKGTAKGIGKGVKWGGIGLATGGYYAGKGLYGFTVKDARDWELRKPEATHTRVRVPGPGSTRLTTAKAPFAPKGWQLQPKYKYTGFGTTTLGPPGLSEPYLEYPGGKKVTLTAAPLSKQPTSRIRTTKQLIMIEALKELFPEIYVHIWESINNAYPGETVRVNQVIGLLREKFPETYAAVKDYAADTQERTVARGREETELILEE